MLSYIGFDAKTVDGKTAMAAGGYGYHMWVEVTINGQVYVMDPQVDDNMSWGAYISHDRFCKTYSEVKNQYIKYLYCIGLIYLPDIFLLCLRVVCLHYVYLYIK